ncbi:MAG: hypothetical protein CLLPBCKN_007657 [Chroococcidiopsis cubana SAG 39.79]|uniref:Uncharacterized protein n=1 Tax=Chroococcidiopsis cubana SAG 39.79 TaxID=388085 RepID=A0AB37UT52_9CYAN|nr:hypothetical protein [Chroococcidiopsis cubana]MDZ4878222.1 hypothetical protein [Chroococcidiopsis cubana SAG 39.79]PSB66593.1 hypothetical protein C7B79_00635 [Chroococcidiopsis cubana CCALA 043]RUT14520.1 hypothetical protein DSM107010_00660 [Chroococcidiopsis cubana SAG 39.79]
MNLVRDLIVTKTDKGIALVRLSTGETFTIAKSEIFGLILAIDDACDRDLIVRCAYEICLEKSG